MLGLQYSRADFKKLNEILLIAPWEVIIAAPPTPDIALTNITDIINQSAATCFPFRILESNKSTSVDAKPWIHRHTRREVGGGVRTPAFEIFQGKGLKNPE